MKQQNGTSVQNNNSSTNTIISEMRTNTMELETSEELELNLATNNSAMKTGFTKIELISNLEDKKTEIGEILKESNLNFQSNEIIELKIDGYKTLLLMLIYVFLNHFFFLRYLFHNFDFFQIYNFTSLETLSLNGVGLYSLKDFPHLPKLKKVIFFIQFI